jgi:protein N-terminal methyltransferase
MNLLSDTLAVDVLQRAGRALAKGPHAFLVVKENVVEDESGGEVFDKEDASVTRSHSHLQRLFREAGLRTAHSRLLVLAPRLYSVRTYALQSQ